MSRRRKITFYQFICCNPWFFRYWREIQAGTMSFPRKFKYNLDWTRRIYGRLDRR